MTQEMLQQRFIWNFLALGVCGGFFLTFFIMNKKVDVTNITYSPNEKTWRNGTKVILLWNSFFEAKDYYFGLGSDGFEKYHCEYKDCYMTDKRSYVKPTEYDAIIFHGPTIDNIPASVSRSPFQRYIFFSLESPYHVNTDQFYDNFYNWTMTYRLDSDVPYPYGGIVERSHESDEELKRFNFASKKNWVAWFVSNCITEGGRENYVSALKRFIPVHVYGTCGDFQCERTERNDSCYRLVENKYKFYLSFENSVCTDYVTEKAFNIMRYNTIPVVYGGADYDKVLPANSYINALDYTPKELAALLKKIGNNEEEYMKYLLWKKKHIVKDTLKANGSESKEQHPFCELCKKLHTDRVGKTYSNFNSWWKEDKCKAGYPFSSEEMLSLVP